MSISILHAASNTELASELHLVRLLCLLSEADKRPYKSIKGITKLAKLDFLLRYPTYLEKVLYHFNRDVSILNIHSIERTSIESKMILYRYGPWDARYRSWIGILVSKQLAKINMDGLAINIEITQEGIVIANRFRSESLFDDTFTRSDIIHTIVGNYTSTKLSNLIYRLFPEVVSLRQGQDISI